MTEGVAAESHNAKSRLGEKLFQLWLLLIWQIYMFIKDHTSLWDISLLHICYEFLILPVCQVFGNQSLVETRSWQYDVIVCGQQRISPKLFLPSRKTGFYWCRKGAGHLAPPQTLASKQRGRKNNPKEFSSHIASNSKPGRFAQKNCRCRLESSGVVVTQVGVNDK